MNKKLITPIMMWLLFVIVDLSALANGITNHKSLQAVVAGIALLISTGFLLSLIQRCNTRNLKPVRVRVKK